MLKRFNTFKSLKQFKDLLGADTVYAFEPFELVEHFER
jgi:hypothetical protein